MPFLVGLVSSTTEEKGTSKTRCCTFTAIIKDKHRKHFSLCWIWKTSKRNFAFLSEYDILSLRNNKVDLPPAVLLNQLDLGPGRLWNQSLIVKAHFASSRYWIKSFCNLSRGFQCVFFHWKWLKWWIHTVLGLFLN